MKNELKCCPFCGDRAEVISAVDSEGDKMYGVRCLNIACIGADIAPHFFSLSHAVKVWNGRVFDGANQD